VPDPTIPVHRLKKCQVVSHILAAVSESSEFVRLVDVVNQKRQHETDREVLVG
jgi:hypothetical protein